MKNKNKKKKKKTKKDKKEDEKDEGSGKEESVEPVEDGPKVDVNADAVTEDKSKDDINDEVKEDDQEEVKEEVKEEAKEAKEEAKDEPKEEPKEETTQEKAELENSSKGDLNDESNGEPTNKVNKSTKVPSSEATPNEEDTITQELGELKVTEPLTEEKPVTAATNESTTSDPTEDLFPDSGPSFMESLQQSKADEALLKSQKENELLKKELEKLKNENKSLKMLKLEHLDQLETLEAKVSDLESKLAKARVDSSNHNTLGPSAYDQEDTLSLSPTPSFQQNFPTSFSQFKPHNKNESQLNLSEIKARLSKWKGWNIDMTSWRSVGSGPIVEL